jgi:multidrug efflux pump subunit AcrA (membrane-fusion protein)
LRCGGFAKAAIRVRTDPAVKTVPPYAIVTFAGVTKLFVAEAGKAKPIPVEIGTRDKDWTEVIGDVPADAVVITSGLSQLVDGSPIKVREDVAK